MFLRRVADSLRKLRNFPSAVAASSFAKKPTNSLLIAERFKIFGGNGFGDYTWNEQHKRTFQWILLSGQAAIILGIHVSPALAEGSSIDSNSENTSGMEVSGLHRIEDGSVISNIHTSKWRVFTDTARDSFLQGKIDEAEKLFLSALQEAKEGFGERDPHVASACNNLAELYRVKKEFGKAEPLYLEAIDILEESFGADDVRVGAALHNLGQFYLIQRKLEQSRACYERALKIKRRVLGEGHTDYADTMYHLGTVLYLLGKEKDAEALIRDSIQILEDAGLGESITYLRRLKYLAQVLHHDQWPLRVTVEKTSISAFRSNRIAEAENMQRKILHVLELSKGWNSMDTVIAAERLALTLQSGGSLREAEELLKRCLDARKNLLPEDHTETAANMLYIARVKMLNSSRLRKADISHAVSELDKAKDLLSGSIRIAQKNLVQLVKQGRNQQSLGAVRKDGKTEHTAMLILLQSLNELALLEITKLELQESREDNLPAIEAEKIFHQCVSAFKEFATETSLSNSPEVKAEYLSCLKQLLALIDYSTTRSSQQASKSLMEELKGEIKRAEDELSSARRRPS